MGVITLLAAAAALAAAQELTIHHSKKEDCAEKVAFGDKVSIEHQGFVGATQFDGNPNGEPLVFMLGAGNILAGMERAISGGCPGDELSVEIPPELAFDDPSKQFGDRKPVPDGSTVTYHIRILGVEKGSGPASLPRRRAMPPPPPPPMGVLETGYVTLSENSGTIGFLALVLLVVAVVRSPSNAGSKQKKKKKKG